MATQAHEFRAKSVDDAIDEGLRALALSRSDVDIEVVQKGSRGILGFGSEPAIVRLTPRQPTAAPVVPAVVPPVAPSLEPPEEPSAALPATQPVESAPAPAEPVVEVPVISAPVETADITPATPPAVTESATTHEETATDQEVAEMAADRLREMVRLMGFEAEVRASWQEEGTEPSGDPDEDEEEAGQVQSGRYLLLDIEGTDLGALIGRRGETLENIQYLLRLMVNQKVHKWKNIVIDVEHYKSRRVAQLTQLAERMAEQVSRTGRSISLEPMPANERRIVHMTLRGHPEVYTESYGDGGRRKVHIFAKSA
ncbi:MAG: Jag N-terminal domain-containing protein [Caldilineaceae bacterium]|nr:Jag N-terminal domain-containing protein [Caldilineaceae bacterium]